MRRILVLYLLVLTPAFPPNPAGACPELSRRGLRPQPDQAGLEQALSGLEGTPQERAKVILNRLRQTPPESRRIHSARRDFGIRVRIALETALEREGWRRPMRWGSVVDPLASKLARHVELSGWDAELEEAFIQTVIQEIRELREEPLSLSWSQIARILPQKSPQEVRVLFDVLSERLPRAPASARRQLLLAQDPLRKARELSDRLRPEPPLHDSSPAAGLEEEKRVGVLLRRGVERRGREPVQISFLCVFNEERSPALHMLTEDFLQRRQIDWISVDSAAVNPWLWDEPSGVIAVSPRTVEMVSGGYALGVPDPLIRRFMNRAGKPASVELLERSDLILVTNRTHRSAIEAKLHQIFDAAAPGTSQRIQAIMEKVVFLMGLVPAGRPTEGPNGNLGLPDYSLESTELYLRGLQDLLAPLFDQILAVDATRRAAGMEEAGVRFISDTGGGVPGVLEVAALGAGMRAAGLEQVQFAAVATEAELAVALAGLEDPVAREILAARTFTYEAGLEASHAFALTMARELVPDPQQVITGLSQETLAWFQEVAERLGVLELYQIFRTRVEELIRAA